MKIAVASRQVSGVTGTSTTVFEHSRRLAALGWEVHVYGDDLDMGRLRACGAAPHLLPRWPIGSRAKRRFFAWLCGRMIARGGFDLVCGHGDTLDQDVLSLHNCVHAAHEAVRGLPLPPSSGVGAMHARILEEKRFRRLIANSQLMKDDVVRRFAVPEDKVTVIRPGFDPLRFRAEDRPWLGPGRRRELGVKEGEVLVGLITSGDFAKRGVELFLQSLAGLAAADKAKLRVLIIGRESRLAPYKSKAAETGLGDRIIFREPAPDVERYYHALDIYVHPALFEEFGQSVQEAMACGLPVLTSARVGASELFKGEARSLLLERPEAGALALRLAELISDGSLRRRWAQEGLRAVLGNTWDENFKATLACYEKLLNSKKM